jgi:hypothetical protein
MAKPPIKWTLLEILRRPERFSELVEKLEALERLEVNMNGLRGVVRFAERNAVISLSDSVIDSTPPPDPGPSLHWETILWRDRALAAGGTFTDNSIAIADPLIRAINATTFNDKIIYLAPLLGANLATARVPLRDRLGVGISTANNFVEGDFSELVGMQGDGISKSLDLLLTPQDVATYLGANRIGYGWWEVNVVPTLGQDADVMGSQDGSQNQTIFRTPANNNWEFQAGFFTGPSATLNPRTRGHYYGQRSGNADRSLYRDAAPEDTNTTSDSTNLGTLAIAAFAFRDIPPNGGIRRWYAGTAALIYVTSGDLTPQEIAEFDALLRTYLIDVTGRIREATTLDGGSASDEFTDILDGGDASDEFTDILDGNPEP